MVTKTLSARRRVRLGRLAPQYLTEQYLTDSIFMFLLELLVCSFSQWRNKVGGSSGRSFGVKGLLSIARKFLAPWRMSTSLFYVDKYGS